SARDRKRRANDSLDGEIGQQAQHAADVDERVDGAELVEVDVLRRHAVHARFRFGEPAEDCKRARSDVLAHVGLADDRSNLGPAHSRVGRLLTDMALQRAQTAPFDRLGLYSAPVDAQLIRDTAQELEVRSGVQQRSKQHVSSAPADAVDVGRAHHSRPAADRAIRAAIVPAPKPSSMSTTARPAAHEHSMERNAVSPLRAEPYPTLVGTPITGDDTSPPTTLASAASIPAQTTTQSARSRSGSAPARR